MGWFNHQSDGLFVGSSRFQRVKSLMDRVDPGGSSLSPGFSTGSLSKDECFNGNVPRGKGEGKGRSWGSSFGVGEILPVFKIPASDGFKQENPRNPHGFGGLVEIPMGLVEIPTNKKRVKIKLRRPPLPQKKQHFEKFRNDHQKWEPPFFNSFYSIGTFSEERSLTSIGFQEMFASEGKKPQLWDAFFFQNEFSIFTLQFFRNP